LQLGELRAAVFAALQMPFELGALVLVQGVERVWGDEVVKVVRHSLTNRRQRRSAARRGSRGPRSAD
jgi:hypothetical protein